MLTGLADRQHGPWAVRIDPRGPLLRSDDVRSAHGPGDCLVVPARTATAWLAGALLASSHLTNP